MTKIRQAPTDLRAPIPVITKRQDRVIIGLRNRIAMRVMPASAFHIAGDDACIGFTMLPFQPPKQRRTKIKT
jgi:hypothetical protein